MLYHFNNIQRFREIETADSPGSAKLTGTKYNLI